MFARFMQLMFSANASGVTTSLRTAVMAPGHPVPTGGGERGGFFIAGSCETFVKYAPSSDDIENGWENYSFIASS